MESSSNLTIVTVLEGEKEEQWEDVHYSPEVNISLFSRVFFTWVTPLFVIANRRSRAGNGLDMDDLFMLPEKDHTDTLLRRFDAKWQKYLNKWEIGAPPLKSSVRRALFWSLFGVIRWRFLLAVALNFLGSTINFFNPIVLNRFLRHIQELALAGQEIPISPNSTLTFVLEGPPAYEGYMWALALVGINFFNGLVETHLYWTLERCGWQIRSTVFSAVFRKSLALSASSLQSVSEGEIINYMQLDSERLEGFVLQATSLWDGVYQIAGYLVVIYLLIGENSFLGLAVMAAAIPINLIIFSFIAVVYGRMAKFTDERTQTTNEMMQAMLGVKLAAWEGIFRERINKFRRKELRQLRLLLVLVALLVAIIFTLPTLGAVAAINAYAQANGVIDAATLFAVVTGFVSLTFPFFEYPAALQAMVNAIIGLRRLSAFLSLSETTNANTDGTGVDNDDDDDDDGDDDDDEDMHAENAIEIVSGEFYWSKGPLAKGDKKSKKKGKAADAALETSSNMIDEEMGVLPQQNAGKRGLPLEATPVLENITFGVRYGELVGIVGSVGSGKSSLLSSILGETFQTKGVRQVQGDTAYSAQTAWIQNATLRDNVLFGLPLDVDRYNRVMQACQFQKDLDLLEDGDQTIIGERGINLSGGQKQRVSLARVAYSEAQIVLLDDPMSALDPNVGKAVFEECILGLLRHRTCVMVTNQLDLLPAFDRIVVLSTNDDVPPRDLTEAPRLRAGYIAEAGTYAELMQSKGILASLVNSYTENEQDGKKPESTSSERESSQGYTPNAISTVKGSDLMQEEERAKGAVSRSVYLNYFKAGGGLLVAGLILLVAIAGEAAEFGNNFVVTLWTDNVNPDGSYTFGSLEFYSYIYFGTAGLVALIALIRGLFYVYVTLRASRKLHDGLLRGVLRAPMSFFDTTPTGRILSRFSKDISEIDQAIPGLLDLFLITVLGFLVSVGSILYSAYFFAVVLPFLIFIYWKIVQFYRPVARDAKRLEAISRSPVYAFFSEAIYGLPTIRAFNKLEDFGEKNVVKVNDNVRGYYVMSAVEKWLFIRLQLLSVLFTAASSILILLAVTYLGISPGVAGLGLTYMLQITENLGGLVESFAELEASMNAVERVNHYSNSIESEGDRTSQNPPPDDWPHRGEIIIQNLEMKYRVNTPLILRGVNVHIEAGTRVGIVGRVGCGKSSLLLQLLRIVEPTAGSIIVDDIDIATIGLEELRRNITIVPQNPTIFSGTVRSNLDPSSIHSDDEIWVALSLTKMHDTVSKLVKGLDARTVEYGRNFSQGQRQLLCLARSLLVKSRVLLLDEATSHVDYETDSIIQTTIRESFKNCTILAIAHRVQTIIDSDKIMVIDDGQVAEYDTPLALLNDPRSSFRAVVEEMPAGMAANLKRLAEGNTPN